jgi:hypothetical protein
MVPIDKRRHQRRPQHQHRLHHHLRPTLYLFDSYKLGLNLYNNSMHRPGLTPQHSQCRPRHVLPSDDSDVIEQGLKNVKTVLAENYVRPDEAEKVKSLVRERGSYKVIDRVTVRLNEKKDCYEATFSNLGIKDAEISAGIVKEFEKLLVGGIWVIATLS